MIYYDPITGRCLHVNMEPEELAEKLYFGMAKGYMMYAEYKDIIEDPMRTVYDDVYGFSMGTDMLLKKEFDAMPFTQMVEKIEVVGHEDVNIYSINRLFWPIKK